MDADERRARHNAWRTRQLIRAEVAAARQREARGVWKLRTDNRHETAAAVDPEFDEINFNIAVELGGLYK